jgi:hypothetical protein
MVWIILLMLGFHLTRQKEEKKEKKTPDLDKLRENGLI